MKTDITIPRMRFTNILSEISHVKGYLQVMLPGDKCIEKIDKAIYLMNLTLDETEEL